MKGTISLLAAVAGIVVAQFPATAQNRVGSQHQSPASSIAHVAARATLLHWGMSQADIARVMGAPSQVGVADDERHCSRPEIFGRADCHDGNDH